MPKGGCSRTPQQEERSLSSDMVEKQPGKKVSSSSPTTPRGPRPGPGEGWGCHCRLSLCSGRRLCRETLLGRQWRNCCAGWLWRTRLAFFKDVCYLGAKAEL